MDAVQKANSGHPGMPMGMADVATILFKYFLKYINKFNLNLFVYYRILLGLFLLYLTL